LTIQKIAPSLILINNNIRIIIYISIILSGFIGSLLGLNQTSLKLIIAYSFINHISWMFMSILIDFYILLIYLIIYSLNNLIIVFFFSYFNINYLNQVYKFNNIRYFMKFIVIIIFISIAGIPPIFVFISKFFVFILIVNNKFFIECLIFIIFTLIVLFY
ncbi:LOW QUALITY PROTEIN: NADH-ubiquinone oxidoreductase chain 2-like, partial [Neodiprion pinetum]|uniref:LOW QUALITY PROTEIN: NADH-ubiquinone oxidoreductase chain 2-like n=1 Tax=Neodiprion pinetum TaxID=441929 RepID=UPI003721F4C4